MSVQPVRFSLLLPLMILAGCQSAPQHAPKRSHPAGNTIIRPLPSTSASATVLPPTSTPNVSQMPTQPAVPSSPMIMKQPAPTGTSAHRLADGRDVPAVQGLLVAADAHLQQGALEEAVTSLERAQRLAPQSASVYLKLAETRLRQGRAVEAEQLARKGLGFSRSGAQQAALWRLISLAAEKQGKADAAQQARQRADQLEAIGDRS
ncbi:TPR repeat protein [Fluviicoccus keumensis]|uniref:TPR repeat protein n=2 Tax=Fluviicoccus keumensis TaxID=1435465 RepID=A0A4Q7Z9K9_9GAMM|nr:TPR repeat protein [Fluviicoccus keumensis]